MINVIKILLTKESASNEIAAELYGYKKIFGTVTVFTVIMNLLMLVPALYMMQVYDRVLTSGNTATLLMITILLVGSLAMNAGLEKVRSMLLIKMSQRLDAKLNSRIYQAAYEQNLKDTGANAGQALADLSTIRQFVTGNGLFAFLDAPWFPIYLLVIFLFSVWLGIFALLSAGSIVLIAWLNEEGTNKPLTEANKLSVSSSNIATNTLRNAEVIHAMGMLPGIRDRWFDTHKKFLDCQTLASAKSSSFTAISNWISQVMGSSMIGVSGYLTLVGLASPGVMIAANVLMGKCTQPVQRLIGAWKQWRSVVSAYQRLGQLLAANPLPAKAMPLPKPKGYLVVDKLTTAAPGAEAMVLKSIEFSIQPGDAMAVVGPSGAGKSTLVKVLAGIWPAKLGSVRLDGVDVFTWNKEELGPNVGYLPQDVQLFAGTVTDNISRFGKPDPGGVVEAARLVGIHEMILKLPKGYDTVLGDGGSGLSGGQKQRIGLARAFYGSPVFVLLDEPNSNLDEEGERALALAILKLRQQGKTIVIMTHRPSIIQSTNKMLMINQGQITAFGETTKILETLATANKQRQAQMIAEASSQKPASVSDANVNNQNTNISKEDYKDADAANGSGRNVGDASETK